MSTAADLREIALSFAGTTEAPHFDRMAFKAARIYVTLNSDGETANLKLAPDEQHFKCLRAPAAFSPVPDAWGRQGWTRIVLSELTVAALRDALALGYAHATTKASPRKKRG